MRSGVAFAVRLNFMQHRFTRRTRFRRAAKFYTADRLFAVRLNFAGIKPRRGFRIYLKFLAPRREKFERCENQKFKCFGDLKLASARYKI